MGEVSSIVRQLYAWLCFHPRYTRCASMPTIIAWKRLYEISIGFKVFSTDH